MSDVICQRSKLIKKNAGSSSDSTYFLGIFSYLRIFKLVPSRTSTDTIDQEPYNSHPDPCHGQDDPPLSAALLLHLRLCPRHATSRL